MSPISVFWMGLPRWAQQTLMVVGFFIMFLIFGRLWLEAHDGQVRKKITDKIRQQELEKEVALRKQAKEIAHEIEDRVAGAKESVRRLPQFESADRLRELDPGLARIILRDP